MKTLLLLILSLLCGLHLEPVVCQTFVSGDISGTWTADGSPFIVIDNCTIPSGQLLEIQPGVEVIIGDSLSISANGRIEAIGNASNHIIFRSPNPDNYWDRIIVYYNGQVSEFIYCDLSNANTAIELHMEGKIRDTMVTKIQNCTFTNCLSTGLFGYVYGYSAWNASFNPHLNPVIKNCTFNNTGNGCVFYIRGTGGNLPGTPGHASPIITNNIFTNIAGTVLKLDKGSYPGSSEPSFINNTIYSCENGLVTQNPYDIETINNIFSNCNIAIQRTDDLSSAVFYNCFYNNTTDFIGYPPSYGSLVMQNHNNDPCDIAFNIYKDPLYHDTIQYQLSENSPCIDAGSPESSFMDLYFPPSLGSTINDIGAYGGPDAGNWLITDIEQILEEEILSDGFFLAQNYPNPFNPETNVVYQLSDAGFVEIKIFDVLGKEVASLVKENQAAGRYSINFNANNLTSGIYFYTLFVGLHNQTRKMILLK